MNIRVCEVQDWNARVNGSARAITGAFNRQPGDKGKGVLMTCCVTLEEPQDITHPRSTSIITEPPLEDKKSRLSVEDKPIWETDDHYMENWVRSSFKETL